jgi:hypothetical protein
MNCTTMHGSTNVIILGPRPTTKTRLHSCNRTQSRVVTGLLTGHNTWRRHLHIMGLCNDPTCRKCGIEKRTSVHILCVCVRVRACLRACVCVCVRARVCVCVRARALPCFYG